MEVQTLKMWQDLSCTMRSLILVFALCSYSSYGALTADAIIQWDMAARHTIVASDLTASTFGSTGGWQDVSPYTFWSAVAGSNQYSFARPVTVSGVSYTGSATNWLYGNEGAASSANYIALNVFGGASSGISQFAIAGFVVFAITNNTGSGVNLDLLLCFPPSGGNWSVLQLQPGINSGVAQMVSHSEIGGNSQFSDGTNIVNRKVYFYIHYRDSAHTVVTNYLYDPDNNFALVAEQHSTIGSEQMYFIEWKVGYIGQIPGFVMWGPCVMFYSPTAQQLSDLVTPLAPPAAIPMGVYSATFSGGVRIGN